MNVEMQECHQVADETLADIDRAIKHSKAGKTAQISKAVDKDYFKSVAYSWFHSRRPRLEHLSNASEFSAIDGGFEIVLKATSKKAARSTYTTALNKSRKALVELRSTLLTAPANLDTKTNDSPPDFSTLVADDVMQAILRNRWAECRKCIDAGAFLAATVMMGGLLEALFVAYANKLPDKSAMFKARTTPKDPKTKKPIPLTQWTLRPYIDVGFELGWISRAGKDIAAVLRDYRNYVHPEKERSHSVRLSQHDSEMFWDVTKHLARQLLAHANTSQSSLTAEA